MGEPTRRALRLGIVCHPAYGGSGVVASELGIALATRGHQVHFFSHSLPFRVPDGIPNTHFHEVEVSSYPVFKYPPYTLSLATKLLEAHRAERLDIVHAHYAIPHTIAAYLFGEMLGGDRPRLITTLHGTDITLVGIDRSFYEITRFALEKSDGLTAVSRYLARETAEQFQPSREVRVIENFIDGTIYRPDRRSDARRRELADPGEALIGHLSNFRPVKRVCDVIRAFYRIQKKVRARLLMMGTGVDLERARSLAAELGISSRVDFLGPIHDVPDVLAQLDLFILPSEYESFGLAALEAMACGVPVISTRTGGVPELIEHGVSGYLCEVGDYECMASLAVDLLRTTPRRDAMRQAARE
ncbi:MAG TPA: N-acetyl-alpha-D-glucosaminyl L-malate synthase BshA, partial [Planctomycetota bacterium]|nr:N-acetyl-alpha-D-glucosaminyl L-malate synthase BshA [Planctomycetota bacterium]